MVNKDKLKKLAKEAEEKFELKALRSALLRISKTSDKESKKIATEVLELFKE